MIITVNPIIKVNMVNNDSVNILLLHLFPNVNNLFENQVKE